MSVPHMILLLMRASDTTLGLLGINPAMGSNRLRPQCRISFGCRASKEDEILIWTRDYKGCGTPWLLLKCLMEGDSCSLITQKQLLNFVRGINRDGSE